MFRCDNCDKRYMSESELRHRFPDIPDLLQRLDVGGVVPAGECPLCGALVYPEAKPVRVLILLDGGLVQNVLTDQPDVEASVLNEDREGVDEDELITVIDGDIELCGTLQAHEADYQPGILEAAWRCA
jgi:hypothetical protein